MATEPERTYPSELPVLALRQTVVFPLTIQPLAINRPPSVEAVNHALAGDRLLFLALQKDEAEEPDESGLHTIGTVAAIRQMAKVPGGGIHVIVEGLMRAKADPFTRSGASLRAMVSIAPEPADKSLEIEAYTRRLRELIDRALSHRDRPVAGPAGPRRRHRRPAAARVPAGEPDRFEGGREAAASSSRTS